MDKYEYKVRADEIKRLIAEGDYAQAAEIADTIDWRRVRSVMMLCTISDLYKINRRFEDARDMLLLAYERRPGGRLICYSLCELSLKTEEYLQAMEYFKEFVQVAPKDPGRYILQYKIYEAQDVSLEERIEVLEELKKRDYREKWAYELAYLYHRVGLATRCVEECDEMILWFGDGKYVYKAMELKMLHQPLTEEQQKKYDNRFQPKDEEGVHEGAQEAIPETEQTGTDTVVYDPVASEEEEIHVKTMDVGEYNTINLQAELAEGLREVLANEQKQSGIEHPTTKAIVAPMLEDSDTETLDPIQVEDVEEDDLEPEAEQMESSEVFFGETSEIQAVMAEGYPEASDETDQDTDSETDTETEAGTETDDTGNMVMEQLRKEVDLLEEQALTAQPPKEIAGVLAQESDGQISLVVPEHEGLEKQITGQMSIEDILSEWERMKKEHQEKSKEEVRQHVLQQTGNMFTEFEAMVRDGLLEQLEKEAEAYEETDGEVSHEAAEEATEEVSEEAIIEIAENVDEAVAREMNQEEEESYEEAEEEAFEELQDTSSELGETEETVAEEPLQETVTEESLQETTQAEDTVLEASEEKTKEEVNQEAKQQLRDLTKEEKELFVPYMHNKSSREQITRAIDGISLAAYTGNVIVTGEEGLDTMGLAKKLVRNLQTTDSNCTGKVAKISGINLNKRNVAEMLEQLQNGALIVEKVSGMEPETANALYKALQKEDFGIVVIFEDVRRQMNRFLEVNEKLLEMFTVRVDMEAMSNDALVAFGRKYARDMEYFIDDLGVLALHTRIENLQTSDHVVTVMEVKDILDEAIKHANRKTVGHFFDVLFGKRYDDEDMIILTEKDFV